MIIAIFEINLISYQIISILKLLGYYNHRFDKFIVLVIFKDKRVNKFNEFKERFQKDEEKSIT